MKIFVRNNKNVSASIRSTLHSRSRFWNISRYAEDVEKILEESDLALLEAISNESKMNIAIESSFTTCFDEKKFARVLYESMVKDFSSAEWEEPLAYGLQFLLPKYQVECVGGLSEKDHGTDIIVKIPGIAGKNEYAVAIQVKDYTGVVDGSVIDQINKADKYWREAEELKVIDKYIIVTKATEDDNLELPNNNSGVKFVFVKELEELLCAIGKSYMGIVDIHDE